MPQPAGAVFSAKGVQDEDGKPRRHNPSHQLQWDIPDLHPEHKWNRVPQNGGNHHDPPVFVGEAEAQHRQIDLRSHGSRLHNGSIPKACVQIDGVTLRDRVDERDDPAEGEAADGGHDLFGCRFVGAEIDDSPADKDDAEQEEQIASPLDRLANCIAHLLIAPEDVSAGRLSECVDRTRYKQESENSYRLKHLCETNKIDDAQPHASAARSSENLCI